MKCTFGMLLIVLALTAGCENTVTHQPIEPINQTPMQIPEIRSDVVSANAHPNRAFMDTTVVPNQRFGNITAKTTLSDLKQIYGDDNVVNGEYYIAEGQCQSGTKLFPKDSDKTVEILWGDEKHHTNPVSIQIYGNRSVWHTPEGITLGTTADQLADLNSAPFIFSGFGWDYGGYVESWNYGRLASLLADSIIIRLDLNPTKDTPAGYDKVLGEEKYSSKALAPFAQDVVVTRMVFSFPQNITKYPEEATTQHQCPAS